MKRSILMLVAALLIGLLAIACVAPPAAAPQSAQPPEEPAAAEEAQPVEGEELTPEKIRAKEKLVVGTAITKPFEFHDPDTNELIGFDVDTAQIIADKLGVEIEWKEMPFASLIPSLRARKVDMTIAAMYIKDEREEVVDFAEPYMETGLVMVVRPEFVDEIKSVEDLAGRAVGVKIGATGDKLAQDLIDQGITLERKQYKETLESFYDLEQGRVDVVFNDYLNTLAYLKDTNSDVVIVQDEDGGPKLLSHVGLGIAVHDGDHALREFINDVLRDMRESGKYDEFYQKWLAATTE